MHLNKNPSPHIDLFRLFGTNTNELQNLKCSSYPVHLNVKHTYANEYEEATDGLKSRKLKCKRCNKVSWTCEKCKNNKVHESA